MPYDPAQIAFSLRWTALIGGAILLAFGGPQAVHALFGATADIIERYRLRRHLRSRRRPQDR